MELKQAVQILKDYNEWLWDNTYLIPELMTYPIEFRRAIDIVVNHMEENFYCRPFERGMIENKCLCQCLGCKKR